jgi:hypothetical protein
MADALSRSLEVARRSKTIPGIRIMNQAKRINHSQFMNDTLLLRGASLIIAKTLKSILKEFLKASRGKISSQKSHVYV